jgi:hypothetical protein
MKQGNAVTQRHTREGIQGEQVTQGEQGTDGEVECSESGQLSAETTHLLQQQYYSLLLTILLVHW